METCNPAWESRTFSPFQTVGCPDISSVDISLLTLHSWQLSVATHGLQVMVALCTCTGQSICDAYLNSSVIFQSKTGHLQRHAFSYVRALLVIPVTWSHHSICCSQKRHATTNLMALFYKAEFYIARIVVSTFFAFVTLTL